MKPWLYIAVMVVGGLIALVGIVAAIGAALPIEHVASRSARFSQPPETIFRTISDFGNAASWRTDVKRVELLEGGLLPRFREHAGHDRVTMEVVEMRPPHMLIVKIADPHLPFGGRWVYELEPVADGTKLTITEQGEVYNPVFRFVARFVFGHHSTIDRYLRALGAKFGADVSIAAS